MLCLLSPSFVCHESGMPMAHGSSSGVKKPAPTPASWVFSPQPKVRHPTARPGQEVPRWCRLRNVVGACKGRGIAKQEAPRTCQLSFYRNSPTVATWALLAASDVKAATCQNVMNVLPKGKGACPFCPKPLLDGGCMGVAFNQIPRLLSDIPFFWILGAYDITLKRTKSILFSPGVAQQPRYILEMVSIRPQSALLLRNLVQVTKIWICSK